MRIALDTNVLVYAEGVNGQNQKTLALELLDRIRHHDLMLPAQASGELYNVLVRKALWKADDARNAVSAWGETFALIATSPAVLVSALDLAADHRFSIWDAVIVAAASSAGCFMLLSEDMQDGFVWGGVTIRNPFAATLHPTVASLLSNRRP